MTDFDLVKSWFDNKEVNKHKNEILNIVKDTQEFEKVKTWVDNNGLYKHKSELLKIIKDLQKKDVKNTNDISSSDIKLWVEQGEFYNHISDINKGRITIENYNAIVDYNYSIESLDDKQLENLLVLSDKVRTFRLEMLTGYKWDNRKRIIGENGKPNVLIFDANSNPEQNDIGGNKFSGRICEKLGNDICAYKFYKAAAERGDEDSKNKLITCEKKLENKYKKINEIIFDAKKIYKESTEESLQRNLTNLVKKHTDIYFKNVEEFVSQSTITTLEECFTTYLFHKSLNWEISQFSGEVNKLSSCIEDMINKLIVERFIKYLKEGVFSEEEHSTKALKDFEDKTGELKDNYKLLLGQFAIFAKKTSFIKWLYSESVNIKICEIVEDEKFKEFEKEWNSFVEVVGNLNSHRRGASHGGAYTYELQFKDCLNEMLFKDNNIFDKILEFAGFPKYDPPVGKDGLSYQKDNNLLEEEIYEQELKVTKLIDFENFYNRLVEYKNRNGHLNIKYNEKDLDNYPLGMGVQNIKRGYVKLSQEQMQQLLDLGLNLESKSKKFDFENFYNRLVEYKNRNGHLHIKTGEKDIDNYPLGQKIAQTRKGYIELTEEQKKKLEKVGIVFKYETQSWFVTFYCLLVDYKNKRGSFIGVENDKILGTIVESIQRQKGIRPRKNLVEGAIDRARIINPQMERVLIKTGLYDYLYSNTKKPDDDGFTV